MSSRATRRNVRKRRGLSHDPTDQPGSLVDTTTRILGPPIRIGRYGSSSLPARAPPKQRVGNLGICLPWKQKIAGSKPASPTLFLAPSALRRRSGGGDEGRS